MIMLFYGNYILYGDYIHYVWNTDQTEPTFTTVFVLCFAEYIIWFFLKWR